ncbi:MULTISPECIES: hypothetical protein [unclassified Oceanispirochaeta]|uniref:hypothetical protein n=1 Tax=unclassified Oceanispirochaeta TaxID=2635722 RepID=UPI000E08D12A|nr:MULTISPECIES: hypothetical protein [unclassified Oceanispirochaeta]MBF9018322.1 hypothetical protein [Oceanispirochaeta sp. M2]NPD74787.1 hypothetical protein [Oceanispirochaeta sp. M1]RDG29340.1 hypothetical protein DV872_22045 [Oceanispirochaeta sp. M1]
MKLSRVFLLTASVFLLLVSCRDGAQLNGPVGNYLYIAMDLPDTEDGQSLSRVIHPESILLTITLTYQNGQVIEGEADLDGLSDVTHTLDQLPVGQGVQLEVSLGLIDLPLCSNTVVVDINPGGNSTDMTLAYSEYTVQGTLVDSAGLAVGAQSLEIDATTTVTTDANGNFSFVVTTEDWDGYTKFYMDYSGEELEFARNKKALIENRTEFSLTAKPEFFVDMTITSGTVPLKGATVGADTGDGFIYTSNSSDENGHLVYGPIDWEYPSQPLTVSVEYKGLFIEYQYESRGAPGAVVGDVNLTDPYVIFMSAEDMNINLFTIYAMDFDSVNTTPEYSLDAQSIIQSIDIESVFTPSGSNGGRIYTDYLNGYIYFFCYANPAATTGKLIIKLDGFSSTVVDYVEVAPSTVFPSYSFPYTVQQLYPIENGAKILATTTNGAFTFSTATMDIVDTWISKDLPNSITILNGGYEAADGTLYVMGEDSDVYGAINNIQRILRLNSDGSMTTVSSLPSPYNDFSSSGLTSGSGFASMIGLYPWTGETVLSVKTQSTPYSDLGGVIVTMKNWSLDSDPVDNSYNYLVPIGILPNNKFYIVNETTSSIIDKTMLRMNSPSDLTPDIKAFMSNPSGANQSMFYYFDPSGLVY